MDPNGDRRHLYSQQATRYLDKDTLKELAKTERHASKRDFQIIVLWKPRLMVVTTHYYEQVETRFIDKETGKLY